MTDPGKEPFPESLDPAALEQTMHVLGQVWGIRGLEVAIESGAGASCALNSRGGIRITLDPQQILEGNPENTTDVMVPPEVTSLFIGGHELGHGRDMLDPEATFHPQTDAEGFFECLIDDTVIDKRNRMVPLLDSYADDIYGMQMPRDLTDKPKHVQLMYGIRIGEVISQPDIVIDPEVQDVIDGLRTYEKNGAVFDVIETMTDRRTSLSERRKIAERFIWPQYHALLDQDRQEQGEQGGQDDAGSGDGDFEDEYAEYQQAVHGHRQSVDPSDDGTQGQVSEQDGTSSEDQTDDTEGDQKHGDSAEDDQNGSESGAEDDALDLAEQIAHAMRTLEEQAADDADEDSADDPADTSGAYERSNEEPVRQATSRVVRIQQREAAIEDMAEIIKEEMGLSKEDARLYARSLDSHRNTIRGVANVFMKLAAPSDVMMSPRYHRRAQSEGVRLHPNALASLAVQLASDQGQNIWQPVERRAHRQEVTFGGLDFYFLGDWSYSMQLDGKAQASADTGLCLTEGLQLARHKVARRPGSAHKPDVRTQFIVFGEQARVISPLAYEPTGQQKGQVYAGLLNPDDGYTYVGGALEYVSRSIAANPKRDAIITIVGDGQFHDFERAKAIVEALPKTAHVAHLVVGQELDDYITQNHEAVMDPENLPTALYEVLRTYIGKVSASHEPHSKFWEDTAPTVEFHR